MMRSPHYIVVAVRNGTGEIVLRNQPFQSMSEKIPILKTPILRGILTLFESLIQGMEALSFSAQFSVSGKESGEKLSWGAMALSMAFAFLFGIGLFVVLPHVLAVWILSASPSTTIEDPLFHLIDGFLKILILLLYVYLIALMKDIRRVFQYHGAEHKSIYTFEAGEALTVENARRHITLHPRCGTSFLLFLVLISILTFSVVFPLFGLVKNSGTPIWNHVLMVVYKTLFMFPVAGLAYEFIKLCACRIHLPLFKWLICPGLMLQKFTTREPDDSQLEVALASLKQVLFLENSGIKDRNQETIKGLAEISSVPATVAEFPEI